MSEERKPVICPWCGYQMASYTESLQGYSGEKTCYYLCAQCCGRSPLAVTNKDAYAAATRRPPNLPLTREQVLVLDDLDAVWIFGETDVALLSAGEARRTYGWLLNRLMIYPHKPTPADIEAARNAE